LKCKSKFLKHCREVFSSRDYDNPKSLTETKELAPKNLKPFQQSFHPHSKVFGECLSQIQRHDDEIAKVDPDVWEWACMCCLRLYMKLLPQKGLQSGMILTHAL
jgi:hypothetical protein